MQLNRLRTHTLLIIISEIGFGVNDRKNKTAKNSKLFNFNVRTQINKTFCVLHALKSPEHLFDTQLAAFSKVHQA